MSKNAPDEDENRGTGTNNANSTSTRILRENSFIEPVVRNPFVHNLVLTKYDKVKFCVNAVFLAPIRFVCICTLISIAIGIAYIATLGVSKRDIKEKPLSGWRRKLRGVLRFCGRAIAFCFGFHHIRKIGTRANRSQATLFVAAPHSSFFDAFVFFVLGLPSGVSRLENASLPFLGHLARACQPIFVDRNDASNKLSTIEEIKRRSDPHSDWPQCLVFPEGTTTNRTCLITFKPGAFIPGLPVQPVAVRYLNRCDTITWTWQGISAYKAMFYTLCQFDNKMEVTYLPVYYPSEQEKADAKLFANNVRTIMADYLQVITTNHTYEDCRLMMKAAEHNLPFESALIEFSKLKEKLDIDFENCEKLLEKYTLYARKSDGKMTLREFCQYLDLPPSEAVNHVFTLYDRDKDGKIDFREFIIGLSLLSRPASTEDTLKLSFQMFDKDGKGHISLADLQSILYSAFAMSSEEVKKLFEQIDHKNDGLITFDEFKSYATQRPEYAKIFEVYHELKFLKNHMEIDKLAESTSSANIRSNTEDKTTESTVVKRPQSDKIRATEPILVAENNSSQNNKKPTELKAE